MLVFLVSQTMDRMKVDTVASSKTASWKDTECITREVKTTQLPSENQIEFCARHNEAVAADMEAYGVKEEQ